MIIVRDISMGIVAPFMIILLVLLNYFWLLLLDSCVSLMFLIHFCPFPLVGVLFFLNIMTGYVLSGNWKYLIFYLSHV